jgi:glycosyltransferase involved in cell wall biosynthesis
VTVALVHDYLTQRGGAERVVATMVRTFPGAPLYTSLFDPDGTYPDFRSADVRTLAIDAVPLLRRRHRLALPILAWSFARLSISADVVLCSSSGWAHGVQTTGRKIVYCYTPARWLYQTDRYLRGRHAIARASLSVLRSHLMAWDRRAAASADRYVTTSSAVRDRIRDVYGIEAEVLPPPPALDPRGPQRAVAGMQSGFLLCVSRLLPYKNVQAVVEAFSELAEERLVVVGEGPERARLRPLAGRNVTFAGSVPDDQLRWLYANARAVVAASYEDYGLTPLEAASFGKPAAVLRWGGFLDTVVAGTTGVFFDAPEARAVREAVAELSTREWSPAALRAHAATFSEERFVERLRSIVEEAVGR